MTRLIYDRRLTDHVPHGEVTTRARVFRLATGLDVLIATELDDDQNPGPSITNTIEKLATSAVEAFGFVFGQVSMEAAQRASGDFRALCSKTLTKATTIFDAGLADALAFLQFPIEHHRSIATTNPIEHLNKDIRRRTRSIGIFPSRESALRLITMILIEQSEEWIVERRYMSPESFELVLQN